MGKLLVVAENNMKLPFLKEKYHFIKLRKKGDVDHMLEVFEMQDTQRLISLKEKIEKFNPKSIVVIGKLKDYRFLATIVCRIFGQYNSWIGQFNQSYGETTLKINGDDVQILAFDTLEDWRKYYENTN